MNKLNLLRSTAIAASLMLGGCATLQALTNFGSTPVTVNQTFTDDGQLLSTGLSVLASLLPAAYQSYANEAIATVNSELADLKASGSNPTTVANLIRQAINNVVNNVKIANPSVQAGISALQGVANVLLADLAPAPAATAAMVPGADPRAALQQFIATH
jgi:hypothetical protein